MKKTVAVIAAIVGVLALLFIATEQTAPPEMTEAERAQIESEVAAVADQLMTALSNLDTSVSEALYDPATMHGNDGTAYFATYDEWVAHNEDLFGRFEELDAGWTNTRVDVLAPDVALFVGQNSVDATQVSGARTNIQGYITLVLKKTEGDWRIIHQASVGRWTPIEEG
jgi:ketosteroid isomerase-like protein